MLRESLAMHVRLLEPGHEKIAAIYNALAEALLSQGNYREAEQRLNEATAILEKAPEHRKELAITLSNLAVVKRAHGRNQDAEKLLTRSVELFESEVGLDHPLLIQLEAGIDSGVGEGIDGVEQRVRHIVIVRRQLRFDSRNREEPANSNVEAIFDREVEVEILQNGIEAYCLLDCKSCSLK